MAPPTPDLVVFLSDDHGYNDSPVFAPSDARTPSLKRLAALGVTVPRDLDGRSFLGVLRGAVRDHRDVIFTTHTGDGANNVYPIRSVRTRQFKYIRNQLPQYAHTTNPDLGGGSGQGRLYYAEWVSAAVTSDGAASTVRRCHQRPGEELYDVLADPFEMKNLAGDPRHATVLSDLRSRLDAWMAAQGDTGRIFNTPIPLGDDGRPAGKR